jgi:hypothetical protein
MDPQSAATALLGNQPNMQQQNPMASQQAYQAMNSVSPAQLQQMLAGASGQPTGQMQAPAPSPLMNQAMAQMGPPTGMAM